MSTFKFKHFTVNQGRSTMKVGTDAMLLGAFVDVANKRRALDIGTGTGVISLMLAQRKTELSIDALDIDSASLEEAKFNFKQSSWSNRLVAHQQNVLSYEVANQYDLIFSNPPFYQDSLHNSDERKASAKHESFLPVQHLIDKVDELLSLDGHFWIIVPKENCTKWIDACIKRKLLLHRSIHIHGKQDDTPKRMIFSFSRKDVEPKIESFTIRNKKGKYTNAYIELTKEYHDRKL